MTYQQGVQEDVEGSKTIRTSRTYDDSLKSISSSAIRRDTAGPCDEMSDEMSETEEISGRSWRKLDSKLRPFSVVVFVLCCFSCQSVCLPSHHVAVLSLAVWFITPVVTASCFCYRSPVQGFCLNFCWIVTATVGGQLLKPVFRGSSCHPTILIQK